jgi:glyoxylase-like metal-dependent hydrolase (beta-lactamase superfamily II)
VPTLVHRIPGVRGANAWLVASPEGLVLVDTGLPGNGARVVAFLAALGRGPRDLSAIALTHYDPDHAGSAAEVRALTGAPIAIHAHDAPVLAGGLTPSGAKGPWRGRTLVARLARLGHESGMALLVRLPFARATWRRCTADRLLAEGDRLPGLTVVHAPGHTAGSVAFRTAEGALLTGDAVFGDAHGRAHYPPRALALDPEQARATAHRLVASGFTTLYPGHGEPVPARPGRPDRGAGPGSPPGS